MVPLGGRKQRALLAFLLLERNRPISRDRLIDGLWGERPPATASHTLDAYISRLRKLVGPDRLARDAGGYSLRVHPDELDLDTFEHLVADARESLSGGDPEAAAATLRSALALWRGPALADLLFEPFAAHVAEELEERRLVALEDRIEADLACGRGGELVGELDALVSANPFRERLLGQLMLALYRGGQQTRALEAYARGRRRLADELGLEPARQLQDLERAILTHDPGLIAPGRRRARPRSGRHRGLRLGLAAAAVTGAAATLVLLRSGNTGATEISASVDQVVALSPGTGAPRSAAAIASAPAAMAVGFGSLWLADPSTGSIDRLHAETGSVIDRIPVGGTPAAVTVGGGSVWVASVPGDRVLRIDPTTGAVTQTVPLGGAQLSALTFGRGALWVADATDQSLLDVDVGTGTIRKTIALALTPGALAVLGNAIWVADYDEGTVTEVEPRGGNVLATVRVGTGPTALVPAGGSLWVANALDSTVSRIDVGRGSVTAAVPVEGGPAALLAANGSLWVANQYAASVSRIDPKRAVVLRTTAVGGSPTTLAAAAGRVWVGTQSLAQHRGGTLVLLHTRPITVDPALQADLLPLVSDGLTRDGLVTFDHVPGSAGTRLVPDLAVTVPVPTDGGTTYTFRLRPNIRYSDGRALRAADFRRAIERTFRLGALTRFPYTSLVGADACSTRRCDLASGIVTDESARSVTFHLRAPDPNFLDGLTAAAASAMPPGTPWSRVGSTPIPGTGPYRIETAGLRRIVWVRNRFFHEWSHAAQPEGNPDRIVLRFGLTAAQAVREVAAGRADASVDNIPASMLPLIQRQYPARLHSYVIPTTDFFHFNTRLAPFDDVRVRRALNYAIDRSAIVRLYGGSTFATVACQVLPPGVVGYHRYCPYTRDLARARRLVAASGTRGAKVTVWGQTDDPTISEGVIRYVAGVLRSLGYRAGARMEPNAFYMHASPARFSSIQLSAAGWGDTPYGYFATWFACDGPNTHGWFCDPSIDRANARARSLEATSPREAAALWARIDRRLVDRAAWLPMINERGLAFVSSRVRNYQSNPYFGLIADQLWLD